MVAFARATGLGGRLNRKQTGSLLARDWWDFAGLSRCDASDLYRGAGLCCGYSSRCSARAGCDLRYEDAATVCCSVTSVE
jgi:hypothetical protein